MGLLNVKQIVWALLTGSPAGAVSEACTTVEREDARLTGHVGAVLSSALDEGHQRLYTAGIDCSVKVRGSTRFAMGMVP